MKHREINNTVPVIIYIPDNAVKIKVEATLIDAETDELYTGELKMSLPEITEARIEGEEWEDENAVYVLTDKARKELEEKRRKESIESI